VLLYGPLVGLTAEGSKLGVSLVLLYGPLVGLTAEGSKLGVSLVLLYGPLVGVTAEGSKLGVSLVLLYGPLLRVLSTVITKLLIYSNSSFTANKILSPERQSAQMSKITNDGLTQSGTGCFITVRCTHMVTVSVKGLNSS